MMKDAGFTDACVAYDDELEEDIKSLSHYGLPVGEFILPSWHGHRVSVVSSFHAACPSFHYFLSA
jgi:hypothetical protein